MKNIKKLFSILAVACIISISISLFACDTPLDNRPHGGENIGVGDIIGSIDMEIGNGDRDSSYTESSATKITFSGSSVSVSGSGASVSGADVTINTDGVYILSGSTDDGSVTVSGSTNAKVQLVLDGVEITNANGPAFNITNGKKVIFTLANGSVNKVADGAAYNIYDGAALIDGAIYSQADLVFNGEGELTVDGNNAHAIVSKDKITFTGGKYTVVSKSSGIFGKDSVKIANADIKINAGTDAIKSDNALEDTKGFIYIESGSLDIEANNDGIQAYNVANISGGDIKIKTTSTSSTLSAKAIKGGNGVAISSGSFAIDSQDDAIHSNGSIAISGGSFEISTEDDGIHADKTLGISGGNIHINKSYEGIEGTDIIISDGYVEINSTDDGMNASGGNDTNAGDKFAASFGTINISGGYIIMHNEGDGVDSNGSVEISGGVVLVDGPSHGGNGSFDYGSSAKIYGGVVITLGTSDMAQNFTEATQGSILVSTNGYFTAGTTLSLCDENGNVILAFTSTKSFNGALFSAPEIEKGKTYTFYTGATVEGLDENGYAHNTIQTGGESCGSITVDELVCGRGAGAPGGMPGGRPPRH